MSLLALSIISVLSEARYISVVFSESCPIPSLMTESGMFLLLATVAQEWRATYMVSGMESCNMLPINYNFFLTRCSALLYCFLSSFPVL